MGKLLTLIYATVSYSLAPFPLVVPIYRLSESSAEFGHSPQQIRDSETLFDELIMDNEEWFVEEITGHAYEGRSLKFQVLWSAGDSTWEPLSSVNKLLALQDYLDLRGVKRPSDLLRSDR